MINQNHNQTQTTTQTTNYIQTINLRMAPHIKRLETVVSFFKLRDSVSKISDMSEETVNDVFDLYTSLTTYKTQPIVMSYSNYLLVKSLHKLKSDTNNVTINKIFINGCDCEELRNISNLESQHFGTGIVLTQRSYTEDDCKYNITQKF